MENASGKAKMAESVRASVRRLVRRPRAFFVSRPFGLVYVCFFFFLSFFSPAVLWGGGGGTHLPIVIIFPIFFFFFVGRRLMDGLGN
jgi:hypothetical protein